MENANVNDTSVVQIPRTLNETSIRFNSISTNCKYITDSFFIKKLSLQTLYFSLRSMQFFLQSSSETSLSKLHLTSVASSKSSTTASFSITASLNHAPKSSALLMNLPWIRNPLRRRQWHVQRWYFVLRNAAVKTMTTKGTTPSRSNSVTTIRLRIFFLAQSIIQIL